MNWERALEADARLAAKNAVLIRAALRQSFDPERAFIGYKNTQPDEKLTLPQQRVRARAWAIMNIRPNLEPLRQVLYKLWADGYVLGDFAARIAVIELKRLQKADVSGVVDWSTWEPGDKTSALLLKPPKAFQRLLANAGITLKGFSDTTLTDIGNAIGEAIELGLDAKTSAKNIMKHVANPARALSIAITEQNRAISTATANRYLEMGVEQMKWLVFQPCEICAKNENVKVSIGAPFPSGHTQPPAHPHCRCALAAVPLSDSDPANTAGTMNQPIIAPDGTVTQEPAGNYRGFHRAPTRADEFGSPATNIEEMMPDFYERPNIYTTGMPEADKESLEVLRRIKDNPEALVTIYRAVPTGVNQINPGDWVTLSPSYAETHLAGNVQGGGRVISMQIRAKDLWFDGDSINEFGYDPIDKTPIKVSFAGRDIVPEVKELFATDPIGRFVDKSLVEEIEEMNTKDLAAGGTRGDNLLKKIVKLQGFDGLPQVVETAEEVKALAKTTPGKVLYRGIADFSKGAEDLGYLPVSPTVTLPAEQAVKDFVEGDYRAGWGAFGSGTYTSVRSQEATQYAQSDGDGGVGKGRLLTMFLPDTALMPTEEVVKETMKEVIRGASDWSGGNVGRALAAKGYQAYHVGFLDPDKEGIYVILDRTAVTVARKAEKK